MFFEFSGEVVLLLMGVAFFAGFVDSIAGGGGLITLPALILAGADPISALATNKVQGLFGSGSAALSYARAGHVNLAQQKGPALAAFCASMVGAVLATHLPVEVIKQGLPYLLIAVALFFAFKPGLTDADGKMRMAPAVFAGTMVPLVGFYDGFIGPGAGSFYMISFVLLAGYGVLKATAHTKLLNFSSNIGGLVAFAVVANPLWLTGIAMGLGQSAGAIVGSRLAMKVGAKVIKPLLVITSAGLALRLFLA